MAEAGTKTAAQQVIEIMDQALGKSKGLRDRATVAATLSVGIAAENKGKAISGGVLPARVVDALFTLVELVGILATAQCETAAQLAERNAREFRCEVELKQAQDFVAGIQAEMARQGLIIPGGLKGK